MKKVLKKKVNLSTTKALPIVFGIFITSALSFSIYHFYYAKKIIPGVVVAGVNLSGMDAKSAISALASLESHGKELSLIFEDNVYVLKSEEISLKYDWPASIMRAFEVGRTGNFIVDTKDKVAGIFKPLKLKAKYSFDSEKLGAQLSKINGELDVEGNDAHFVLEQGVLKTVESTPGRKVDDPLLNKMVINSFDFYEFSSKVVPIDDVVATIVLIDLEKVSKEAENIVFNELTLSLEDNDIWWFSPQEMLNFLSVKKTAEEKNTKGGVVSLSLNTVTFEAFLEELGRNLNKQPRGKVTKVEEDRVVAFEITEKGSVLDVKKFTESFKDAYFSIKPMVETPMQEITGYDDPNAYGIFTLLGEGNSKFTGSIAPREHNLILAAQRASGVLVPPGESFSFNKSVGEISGSTGYDAAYIIANGRTVLGEGGGVCQTSTTLFRAILNSGLPVTARHPHAYRVGYYELDMPVGFDASIYQPSLDLQFKNDTPNYVLVQSDWNLVEKTLTFKIYGTPDGREVEISEPIISGAVPPPEALYEDDPSLPKGVIRQVDYSAWGTNSTFTRTVSREGTILYEDTFSSTYQPWRAIFKVGTGT